MGIKCGWITGGGGVGDEEEEFIQQSSDRWRLPGLLGLFCILNRFLFPIGEYRVTFYPTDP